MFVTAAIYLIIIFEASVLPDPLSPVDEKTDVTMTSSNKYKTFSS